MWVAYQFEIDRQKIITSNRSQLIKLKFIALRSEFTIYRVFRFSQTRRKRELGTITGFQT